MSHHGFCYFSICQMIELVFLTCPAATCERHGSLVVKRLILGAPTHRGRRMQSQGVRAIGPGRAPPRCRATLLKTRSCPPVLPSVLPAVTARATLGAGSHPSVSPGRPPGTGSGLQAAVRPKSGTNTGQSHMGNTRGPWLQGALLGAHWLGAHVFGGHLPAFKTQFKSTGKAVGPWDQSPDLHIAPCTPAETVLRIWRNCH